MTVNTIMAVILHYFTEFGTFRAPLCRSGWRNTNTFCDRNV